MRLADFDYVLPEERIAQHPLEPRDSARLLVDRGSAAPLHRHVSDLGDHLRDGDLLVVNDTKVIPARLKLHRATGGAAEVLLLEPLDGERRTWEAMVRPAKKMKPAEELLAAGRPLVRILRRSDAGDTMIVELMGEGDPLALLAAYGEMPLPPYISARLHRQERYQTVYANEPASAAAPTAGLHFTPELRAEALEVVKNYRMGPLFTPPSMAVPGVSLGTLQLPGNQGAALWQGASWDPETRMLYVPSVTNMTNQVLQPGTARTDMRYVGTSAPAASTTVGPGVTVGPWGIGPQGLPLVKPPYGRITAYNMDTGDIAFQVANGDTYEWMTTHPALKGMDIPKTGRADEGGIVVTKTLLFAGQGCGLFRRGAGGGHVDYSWAKAGEEDPVPKTSYAVLYQPWGWVIGTGVYVDDTQAQALQFTFIMTVAGGLLVGAHLDVRGPAGTDLVAVRDELERLAAELLVELGIDDQGTGGL